MTRQTITVSWPPVPGAPGYDLFENGRKVASSVGAGAKFGVVTGDQIGIVAQQPAPPIPPGPVFTKTFTQSGKSIDQFLDSLVAGDVAGLGPGSYPFSSYQRKAHGTVDHPIVLTSIDPAHPAIIQGRFVTYAGDPSTPAGDYWTLRLLGIDGRTPDASSMTIQSRGVLLDQCDLSNWNTNIGIIVQSSANGFTVSRSRIHDVGILNPRDNQAHGVYDEGNQTHVVDTMIYRCSARGLQDRGGHGSNYEHSTLWKNGEGIIYGDDRGAVNCVASQLILLDQQEPARYLIEALGSANSGNTLSDSIVFSSDGYALVQPGISDSVTVTNLHLIDPILDGNLMPTLPAAIGYGCRVVPPKILPNA